MKERKQNNAAPRLPLDRTLRVRLYKNQISNHVCAGEIWEPWDRKTHPKEKGMFPETYMHCDLQGCGRIPYAVKKRPSANNRSSKIRFMSSLVLLSAILLHLVLILKNLCWTHTKNCFDTRITHTVLKSKTNSFKVKDNVHVPDPSVQPEAHFTQDLFSLIDVNRRPVFRRMISFILHWKRWHSDKRKQKILLYNHKWRVHKFKNIYTISEEQKKTKMFCISHGMHHDCVLVSKLLPVYDHHINWAKFSSELTAGEASDILEAVKLIIKQQTNNIRHQNRNAPK